MKTLFNHTRKICMLGALPAALLLNACDIDQTQEAKLPDVDVKVESGQLPKYEVTQTQEGKLPDVDVDAKGGQLPKFKVETADVDVGSKTIEVTVPTIDVQMPDENENQPAREGQTKSSS